MIFDFFLLVFLSPLLFRGELNISTIVVTATVEVNNKKSEILRFNPKYLAFYLYIH